MIILLIVSLFLCGFVLVLMTSGINFFFSVNFLSFMGCNWLVNFDFDNVTFGIMVMLLICFIYVWFYNDHYFIGDNNSSGLLIKIVSLFVSVMGVLICTGDFLSTLIFWEYLGVVSFFLILFYDNFLSLRSSVITLISSRFGDVCFVLLIGLNCYTFNSLLPCLIYFFMIIFTKSAGFPFISWLIEAMRAPTPVSSLVHSSTLVAAGVWFSMRYDYLQFFNYHSLFSVILLLTIFISGICSMFFVDLKKIIALSTCNNISWCIIYLLYGDVLLSLFQLLSHGVSKCMLFMLVGDVMSGSGGSQSSNCVYSSYFYGNLNIFGCFSVILGLSGVPFIGIFFTKHFLLSVFINISTVFVMLFVLFCMLISYIYSFRLCSILLNSNSSVSSGVLFYFNSGVIVYFWLFMNFYFYFILDELVYVTTCLSLCLILFQLFSIIVAIKLYSCNLFSSWSSSLFGCDNIVELVYKFFTNMSNIVNLFIFRWDNLMLSLFSGVGCISINSYNSVMLSILFFNIVGLIIYLLIM
uniref:NADH:ubiquinone reductase (H(+)-translocating) n=1 Tax=Versteria mustelae TaxID=1434714 RepID=A0A4D6E5G6_9CEST|nr:NADH dehydrogenase subunit 5 [Versteria mustelae]